MSISPMIEGVHKLANHLCKKKGYATTISVYDVAIILEAYYLIEKEYIDEFGGRRKNSKAK